MITLDSVRSHLGSPLPAISARKGNRQPVSSMGKSYTVYCIYYILYVLYTVCSVYCMYCILYVLYTVYTVYCMYYVFDGQHGVQALRLHCPQTIIDVVCTSFSDFHYGTK